MPDTKEELSLFIREELKKKRLDISEQEANQIIFAITKVVKSKEEVKAFLKAYN